MNFAPKNWTVPQTSLKLGDRLLLIGEGGGREGEVVALDIVGLCSSPTFRRNSNLCLGDVEPTGKGAATSHQIDSVPAKSMLFGRAGPDLITK